MGVCARLRAGCTILSLHPILPSRTVRNGADLGGNLPKTAPSRLPRLRLPLTAALGSPRPAHHPQVPRTIPQVGPGAGVPTCGAPGAARLLHLPGEAVRAHLSGLWPRLLPAVLQHPPCPRLRATLLPRVPQDLQAEGPPGPGGEDEAPAAEAAAHRAAGAQASSRPGALTSHWDVTEGGGVRGGRSPAWELREPCLRAQETCAVRAQPLLLVRVNASGGLILRMGAVNRCLKHPLARDTPVCLLAVLGERHSGKTFLLNHLLQGLPGLVRARLGRGLGAGAGTQPGLGRGGGRMGQWTLCFSAPQEPGEGGWPREGCSGQGFRWGANSLTRGLWMWSHPFLLGKEGRKVRGEGAEESRPAHGEGNRVGNLWGPGREDGAGRGTWGARQADPSVCTLASTQVAVFLVDTGDAMSPELSRETRTRLCALTSMLSSYQVRPPSPSACPAPLSPPTLGPSQPGLALQAPGTVPFIPEAPVSGIPAGSWGTPARGCLQSV